MCDVPHLGLGRLEHLKALTSSMVTTLSDLAILAPSAITATANATRSSAPSVPLLVAIHGVMRRHNSDKRTNRYRIPLRIATTGGLSSFMGLEYFGSP